MTELIASIAAILTALWGFYEHFFSDKAKLLKLERQRDKAQRQLHEAVLDGDNDHHVLANELERLQQQIDRIIRR